MPGEAAQWIWANPAEPVFPALRAVGAVFRQIEDNITPHWDVVAPFVVFQGPGLFGAIEAPQIVDATVCRGCTASALKDGLCEQDQ